MGTYTLTQHWKDLFGQLDWDWHLTLRNCPAATNRDAMDRQVRHWLIDCQREIWGKQRDRKGWRIARSVSYGRSKNDGTWHCHILLKFPEQDARYDIYGIRTVLREKWAARQRRVTEHEYYRATYEPASIQAGYGAREGSFTIPSTKYDGLGWCQRASYIPSDADSLRKCGLEATPSRLKAFS